MGQLHLGRRNRMCEDLEVFNSIRMVVFSLDWVRAQALGRSAEGKRTEQWSGARSWGPCVLASKDVDTITSRKPR